jgi:hypothetical protein
LLPQGFGLKRMKKLVFALVVMLAVWGLYKLKYPLYTYHYRMTVEVDAGGEIRSGSSVIEVNARRQPQLLLEIGPFETWARGQAVFITLPSGKNLVALLASGPKGQNADYPTQIVHRLFNGGVEQLPSLHGRRELTPDQMPTLVTVIDPSDGASAQEVKPEALDSFLGARLRFTSIEMTTDPITATDIEAHLPFLIEKRKERLEMDFPRYSYFVRR